MKYHQIIRQDTANGIGIRISLFVSGCTRNCPDCHNQKGQNFDFGWEFTKEVQEQIFEEIRKFPIYDGISVLGGEPFERKNISTVASFVSDFRKEFPDKTIWIYSGNTYEEIIEMRDNSSKALRLSIQNILTNANVLVDGSFVAEQKDLMLSYRGSANQRIIDLKETLKQNKVVTLNFDQNRRETLHSD